MPKQGGARKPNDGSVEAHEHHNRSAFDRTFSTRSDAPVTGRACERCGVRGTKLQKTIVTSASWRAGENVVGRAAMMCCPDCAARRNELGAKLRPSMGDIEKRRQEEFRKEHDR